MILILKRAAPYLFAKTYLRKARVRVYVGIKYSARIVEIRAGFSRLSPPLPPYKKTTRDPPSFVSSLFASPSAKSVMTFPKGELPGEYV